MVSDDSIEANLMHDVSVRRSAFPPTEGNLMASDDSTDVDLMHAWKSGDRRAGDVLLRRYTPLLRRFFARRIAHSADELVQRTWLACIQSLGRFEERSSFRTYLLGIARNQYFMSLRHSYRTAPEQMLPCSVPKDSPSQLVAAKEQERVLLGALLQLSKELRMVLDLYYWQGLSVEAIAEQVRARPGTVKSRLARGRLVLRGKIAEANLSREVQEEVLQRLVRNWDRA